MMKRIAQWAMAALSLVLIVLACSKNEPDNPVEAPSITSHTASGPIGSTLIINGTNFGASIAENTVTLNGVAVTLSAANTTKLTGEVPVNATTGKIKVTTAGGSDTSEQNFTVLDDQPTISIIDFEPKEGVLGDFVTITGANFDLGSHATTDVFIGDIQCSIDIYNDDRIKIQIPQEATPSIGPIKIVIGETTVVSENTFAILGGRWIELDTFAGGGLRAGAMWAYNGLIYIGNGTGDGDAGDFWSYDPASGVFEQLENYPGLSYIAGVSFQIDGILYYGGGTTGNDFWAFDTSNPEQGWTQKANIAEEGKSRSSAATFVIDGMGYVIWGRNANSPYTDLLRYNPENDTWTSLPGPDMEGRADHSIAFSINGKGYVGTGNTNDAFHNDFWEFDPSIGDNGTWMQKANVPGEQRSSAVGLALNNFGYVGMGYGFNSVYFKDFWKYDPANDSWSKVASHPGEYGRFSPSFTTLNGKGYIGFGSFDTPDGVDPNISILYDDIWEFIPEE